MNIWQQDKRNCGKHERQNQNSAIVDDVTGPSAAPLICIYMNAEQQQKRGISLLIRPRVIL